MGSSGTITRSTSVHFAILIPSGSSMSGIPTSTTDSYGGSTAGEYVLEVGTDGTTIDGKVFQSTVEENKPYESKANMFVPGFNEALSLMKKGSKYRVFIPQELAYGAQQRGQLILPFSTLVFEIEILNITK